MRHKNDLDHPISKHICSNDKNCLAVAHSASGNRGFRSCNYPNVIIPASTNTTTLHKKLVMSGINITLNTS